MMDAIYVLDLSLLLLLVLSRPQDLSGSVVWACGMMWFTGHPFMYLNKQNNHRVKEIHQKENPQTVLKNGLEPGL